MEEAERDPSSVDQHDNSAPDNGTASSVTNMGNDDDGALRRKSVTSDFGEDDDEPNMQVSRVVKRRASMGEADRWAVQSQEAVELCNEKCALTIFQNKALGQLRFEALVLSNAKTICITCTEKQFSEMCDEQKGLLGPAKVQAAVRQFFRE